MKKIYLTLVFVLISTNCANKAITSGDQPDISAPVQTQIILESKTPIPENSPIEEETKPEYPGVTIDGEFPVIANHDFREEDFKQKTYSVETEGFQITNKNFTPKTISKNGKVIFNFKTLYPNDYVTNLIGVSRLLSENSKQIYVVTVGPGGVCCTNYWITDVSNNEPRNIFRSEDYGGFRDPMEIFDADGDGVYELMQWDSAFRYFLDDCGACSPEPRAIFKYDKKSGTYLPAKNIQQDFVKEDFLQTEKWILESFAKLEKFEKNNETENQEYLSLLLDYNRRFLDYNVNLFYLGDEKKAWKTFDKYYNGYNEKEKVRAEIKSRLRQSKFFQALRKSS